MNLCNEDYGWINIKGNVWRWLLLDYSSMKDMKVLSK
jgi:hypothetical protein